MWRFVLQENIAHLRLLISRLEDPATLARLQHELWQAESELAELDQLSAHAHAAHDASFAQLLTAILREQVRLDAANFGIIQLLEAEANILHIAAQINFATSFLRHFREVRAGDGSVYGKAWSDGDGVWVEDVMVAQFFAPHLEVALAAGFRAVKSLPLFRQPEHFFGVLSLHYAEPQTWSEEQRERDRRTARGVSTSLLSIRPSL